MTLIMKTATLVLSTYVQYHPFFGSTTSNVLAIGYGVQNEVGYTRRDHGIFAQELDCASVNNNVGRHFGSFAMTTIIC